MDEQEEKGDILADDQSEISEVPKKDINFWIQQKVISSPSLWLSF